LKLLFVDDARFYRDNDTVYNAGVFPASYWIHNYLPWFDSINIIGRLSGDPKDKNIITSVDTGRTKFILLSEYKSILHFFINYFLIREKIKNEAINAEIAFVRVPGILAFMAVDILLKYKKPFIVEVVSNTFDAFWKNGSLAGKLSAFCLDAIAKKCLKKAPYALYVSRKLQKDYPTKGKALVLSDVILPDMMSEEEIDPARFNGGIFKIGLTGSFAAKYKGQNILLKAIKLLPKNIRDNVELYFAGVGDYEWLTKLVKRMNLDRNIRFIGEKAHDSIFGFLKSLALYVQPSFVEGMPRAMLEAMSVGCPVLGSTTGGIPEVLSGELMHRPGDYKRFSAQIRRFYDNRELLIQEARKNLERAKPFYKETLDKKRAAFFVEIINTARFHTPPTM
jgi:glycosyltransferase involved in cell wall biosynthesis